MLGIAILAILIFTGLGYGAYVLWTSRRGAVMRVLSDSDLVQVHELAQKNAARAARRQLGNLAHREARTVRAAEREILSRRKKGRWARGEDE